MGAPDRYTPVTQRPTFRKDLLEMSDEEVIWDLKAQGAAIDVWGVGTRMITSMGNPALGGVYKLAEIERDGKAVPKLKKSDSIEKITNPGFKTVYRIYEKESGKAFADLIALKNERERLESKLNATPPLKALEAKVEKQASVSPEIEYGAAVIGTGRSDFLESKTESQALRIKAPAEESELSEPNAFVRV